MSALPPPNAMGSMSLPLGQPASSISSVSPLFLVLLLVALGLGGFALVSALGARSETASLKSRVDALPASPPPSTGGDNPSPGPDPAPAGPPLLPPPMSFFLPLARATQVQGQSGAGRTVFTFPLPAASAIANYDADLQYSMRLTWLAMSLLPTQYLDRFLHLHFTDGTTYAVRYSEQEEDTGTSSTKPLRAALTATDISSSSANRRMFTAGFYDRGGAFQHTDFRVRAVGFNRNSDNGGCVIDTSHCALMRTSGYAISETVAVTLPAGKTCDQVVVTLTAASEAPNPPDNGCQLDVQWLPLSQ